MNNILIKTWKSSTDSKKNEFYGFHKKRIQKNDIMWESK
jgi:hypothetical protein